MRFASFPVSLRRAVIAVTALAAVLGGVRSPGEAAPALWVAESGQAKLYLFGTVHVLRPEIVWHTPALDAALAESSDLWLEVANADDATAGAPLVRSLGLDPAHPLSSKLSAVDLARVDRAAKALGAPGEGTLEPMRPWLASVTLSMLPLTRAGYDPKSGVDVQLKNAFAARSKAIRGFETLDQQMHFFADLPQDQEVAMLDATLDEVDTASTTLDGLVTAWSNGDVERFAAVTKLSMFKGAPMLYELLVVQRNAAWVRSLAARLQQPGVSFIAVGAAHLSGSSSVQAGLERLGYRVRRIQ